ncbi:MAG TPA: magnesium and cobalt transport protein CorA [Gaiellaceae bacterium]|nr:magnesium and cobalt transport protein CorA [Gaiellaceae bacterium]
MIVDCAVYGEGHRLERHREVTGVRAEAAAARGFAWVGLVEPTMQEFDAIRREFDLHELAVEDAVGAHQRPKLEIYGDTLFLVLKTVRYLEAEERLEIGEVMVFVGTDFVITVRHGEAGGLGDVREQLEQQQELLAIGPGAALHAIVDRIVDAYTLVAESIHEAIDEVEADVFSPQSPSPVERIYRLRREALEFSRAAGPLRPALRELTAPGVPNIDPQLIPYLRDVADNADRVGDQVDGFGTLLAGALQATLTQVSVRQNEDMRRISAWVAIIAVPTAVAGIYGMNFEHMPELEWRFGYPAVLLLILAVCTGLYVRFRRVGWL